MSFSSIQQNIQKALQAPAGKTSSYQARATTNKLKVTNNARLENTNASLCIQWAAITNLPYPVVHADYQKNQPTRKLTQAAGKNEGDANIFPSTALQLHVQLHKHVLACVLFADKEAGKKMSEAKDR